MNVQELEAVFDDVQTPSFPDPALRPKYQKTLRGLAQIDQKGLLPGVWASERLQEAEAYQWDQGVWNKALSAVNPDETDVESILATVDAATKLTTIVQPHSIPGMLHFILVRQGKFGKGSDYYWGTVKPGEIEETFAIEGSARVRNGRVKALEILEDGPLKEHEDKMGIAVVLFAMYAAHFNELPNKPMRIG